MADTQVIIAGGGSVGMTRALELAGHGVRSIVLERNQTTTRHPKMDLTNGRSMELFRRLGMSDRLRSAGVPEDHAFDIVWAGGGPGVGRELHRFRYPSAREASEIARRENDGTYTCEPGMRVSQIVIEPGLKAAIEASPPVDVRFGWAFESLDQDSDGVTVTVVNRERGARSGIVDLGVKRARKDGFSRVSTWPIGNRSVVVGD